MKSTGHRKRIAAVALFAVLFSALSPAFAAIQYRGHPEVLAQICTSHGLERVSLDGKFPPAAPHDHSIHCAWCSAGTAQPGIGGASIPTVVVPVVFTQAPPAFIATAPAFSVPVAFYFSQAPPLAA
ncbi:MAG TPA: DUF2946 family protein [Burkholderiales bacterium]|nr:DUF2946 family protein [Burkholderiales bacterium]